MKEGDVVRAKAGGPKMTVERMNGPLATVIWFCRRSKLQRTVLHKDVLEPVIPPLSKRPAGD